jgi:FlaA1/EpsC-like NDP-sugar epimerase
VTTDSRGVGRPPLDATAEDDVVFIPEAQHRGSPVLVRYRRIAYALVATDAACILVALVVSSLVASAPFDDATSRLAAAAIASAIWVAVFHGFGLYAPQHLSPAELLRRIVGASSVGVMVLALSTIWSSFPSSRLWVAQTWCLALILELAARRVWAWRFGKLRTAGVLCFRTLIIGTNDEAHRLYETLSARGWGYEPLGFIEVDGDRQRGHGHLGRVEMIDDAIAVHRPDCLFVASSAVDDETMLRVTRAARRHALEVRISANIPQILTDRVTVQ